MHISVSEQDKTSEELLENISGYFPLLYALYPNRIESIFSKAYKKDEYVGRRGAINPKSNNTLELRIFPAIKDVDDLLWRIELVRYFLKYQTNNVQKVYDKIFKENSYLTKHIKKLYPEQSDFLQLSKSFSKFSKELEDVSIKS